MAEYTSGQYKYLLYKRLQKYFSVSTAERRAYTQTFFCMLLDDTVTITSEVYQSMIELIEEIVEYLAEEGIYKLSGMSSSDIEKFEEQITDALAMIGIGFELESSGMTYSGVFTKPDGATMTYTSDLGEVINCRSGVTLPYAALAAPYYRMDNLDVLDLDELDPKIAGPDTYWSYDSSTTTMTISGSGAYAGATESEDLGSGSYTILVVGANVSRLLAECIVSDETTMVLLHGENASIEIDPDFSLQGGTCSSTYTSLDVYTDCQEAIESLNAIDNITLYALSEWEG